MKKPPINPALLASIAAGAALKTKDVSQSAQASPEISCALIDPNPYQPRLDYDPIEVRALADSIEEHGLLQPIVVRRDGDRYTLVAGHTRLEAFKLLGRDMITANIIDVSDIEMASLALIENVQRSDLHPLEIQIAISREPFASMVDEEIAQILGYTNVTKVRNIRSISRLSEEVREHMAQHRPKIGVDLLVELQKYPEQHQIGEYHRIISGERTRSDLRETLRLWNQAQERKAEKEEAQKPIQPFKRDDEGYHIECGKLPKKSRDAFESELFDLMVRHGIRPAKNPP
ncbi:ParB/RepB/Spo0J family partition protein [Sulfuricurvum sp.]|uniref:ParB/RepB/Spo0J family partition protein n=1 Tax=Sulfuricurvum sp. TaxID=2025608 RepID=UPI002D4CE0E8|nr:ParB/RepB/Spo0J family partition protein [Sulfuricurvum sp.]HZF69844.1 ParB/RepB/Spo0J family partition protein [Sulfuricurvum sp.]